MDTYSLVIVGSGPAGYTAAIYAARALLKPLLYEGFFSGPVGGQLMTTTEVENYPGFPEGVLGEHLMQGMRAQAERFGTVFMGEDVISIELQKHPFTVMSKSKSVYAHALIIATGATAKKLEIPGAETFWQKGVTACAVCDGAMPLFRQQDLYVVGGGDSACEEALFLTRYGKKVYLVHRRDTLRASKIMSRRVQEHPKIEVLWNRVMVEIQGDTVVRNVVLEDTLTQKRESRVAAGVFFSIGHQPNIHFLQGQLPHDDTGYLQVKPGTTQTPIAGVFAAGDVQDRVYRQAVTAAGSGCMAALEAERWLTEHGYL